MFVCGIRRSAPELRVSTQRVACPCCLKLCLLFTLWIFLDRGCFQANIFYSGPSIPCIFPLSLLFIEYTFKLCLRKNYFAFYSGYFCCCLTHVGLSVKDVVIYLFSPRNSFLILIKFFIHIYAREHQVLFCITRMDYYGREGNVYISLFILSVLHGETKM